MEHKERTKFNGFVNRLRGINNLPGCVIKDFLAAVGILEKNEKEYIAQHESGHALVNLLEGQEIERATIKKVTGHTHDCINTILGKQTGFVGGEVSQGDANEKLFLENNPFKGVIFMLAGLAATNNSKQDFSALTIRKYLKEGVEGTWDDVSVPYRYIQKRFVACLNRQPSHDEVVAVFYELLDQLKVVFSDSQFARATESIKKRLKKGNLKSDINSKFFDALARDGVTQDDLVQMRQKINGIDIDALVKNSESLLKKRREVSRSSH